MKTFISMCNQNTKANTPSSKVNEMSVEELYKLMEQQKSHLRFLKEMDDLSEEEEASTMKQIKEINILIIKKTSVNITNNSINASS